MTAGLDTALHTQRRLVGKEIGVSGWISVTQEMIDRFADVTCDRQFIHTDPARAARESPYGGTIAHGFLTLSLASRLSREALDAVPGQTAGLNYGLNRVRFLTPVRSGDRIRGRFRLSSVRRHKTYGLLRKFALAIEIENRAKPAMVADWLILGLFKNSS